MGRKKDAIVSEERADSVGVSLEPSGFELLMELFYFSDVSSGQGISCGKDWIGEEESEKQQSSMRFHGSSWLGYMFGRLGSDMGEQPENARRR